ncbi:MAG: DEAD/DEAH box helicase [Kocuria sp.]|nr:DEAD/DEAH box helicase [Kocuria sp.]
MTASQSGLRADLEYGFVDRLAASDRRQHPELISNDGEMTMLRALETELKKSNRFVFSVAFISSGALALLKQCLLDFQGRGTIITSTYLGFNDPDMFLELLALKNIDVHVYPDEASGFHPKGYLFDQDSGQTVIVGSSNLTRKALLSNEEWNLKFAAAPEGHITEQVHRALDKQLRKSELLTPEWIEQYREGWVALVGPEEREAGPRDVLPSGGITPNEMQARALEALTTLRQEGEKRALVVSATGTGKTILAALEVKQAQPQRCLFLAHTEGILNKAKEEFARVLGISMDAIGSIGGGKFQGDRNLTFATVQSMHQAIKNGKLSPADFDYILIDETHRAGSKTYLRIIDYFAPKFLLGLTATPDRMDDFNIYQLFDYNVACDIRLQDALEVGMLAPFNYYGVSDYTDLSGNTVNETSDLAKLVTDERMRHVLSMIKTYGHVGGVRGLIFCSRNDEAVRVASWMTGKVVNGQPLKVRALSGQVPVSERESAMQQLSDGDLDYLVSVDIFNEGIDIPSINQVVMMRGTESSIIFTQQLGRGLRKAAGKDHLRVIDFIGNYSNNFLIPMALYGNSSLNKDELRAKVLESSSIAGVSRVNFDRVARQRIIDSLNQARIGTWGNLSQAVRDLGRRIGAVPRLLDLALHDVADPLLVATLTRTRNYWSFLAEAELVGDCPSEEEAQFLRFLSSEVLSSKRPHEALVLRHLLRVQGGCATIEDLRQVLNGEGVKSIDASLLSSLRVLDFGFSTKQELEKYGDDPVVTRLTDAVRLSNNIADLYASSSSFGTYLDDVIDTSLHLARHRFDWQGGLVVGSRYSKKDVCRLLNWRSNQKGVMFGYRVDTATMTCPVFVNYNKSIGVTSQIDYEDSFDGTSTFTWYSRRGVTLEDKTVRKILDPVNPPKIHLFVRRHIAESREFYYLGKASPRAAENYRMPGDSELVNAVRIRLDIEKPVAAELYDYFEGTPES